MKTALLVSASLSLSQAQAMMDPSDTETSTLPSAVRQQETLSRGDEDTGASSVTASQASDHKQSPDVKNDKTQSLRDQNAAFAKKEMFERRLEALESQLNDAQIGAPRNVIQLSTEQMNRLRRNKQRQLEENEENCQK